MTDEQDSLTDDLLQMTLEAASRAINGQDTNLGVDTALDSSGRQADQIAESIHYPQHASAQATVAGCTELRGSNGDNTPSTSSANASPFPPMVQQPHIFNPFLQSLPQLQHDPFDGNPLKWSDWSGRFQFMIGNTHMTNDQKIAYLQGLTKGRAKETIEGFKCIGDLFHRAMEELRLRFGQPTLIVNEKLVSYAPPVPSRPETYSSFSCFLNAMVHTFKEHIFFADVDSTANLKHATDKMPHCDAIYGINFSSKEKLTTPKLLIET